MTQARTSLDLSHVGTGDAVAGAGANVQWLEVVAIWCQATQGTIPLRRALGRIGRFLGCEVISICRIDRQRPRDFARVVSHDSRAVPAEDVMPFEVSFASGICGMDLEKTKPGSVWAGTLPDFDDRPRLASVYRHRRLAETIVIPLVHQGAHSDCLELHFAHATAPGFCDRIGVLASILADCWKDRALGLLSEAALSARREQVVADGHADILSPENPCRLSRAEYRVCLLLSRGLNNRAILSELSIGMSTLRAHLRNIYAKTGSASQPELIHKLLAGPPARSGRLSAEGIVA